MKAPPGPPPKHRRPSPPNLADKGKLFRETLQGVTSESQAWMTERLSGLTPLDFCPCGCMVYTTQALRPPSGFEHAWQILSNGVNLEKVAKVCCGGIRSAIIFVNLCSSAEVQVALDFAKHIATWQAVTGTPQLIIVPHSSAKAKVDALQVDLMTKLLRAGLDEVVFGEPQGLQLVYAVKARMAHQAQHAVKMNALEDRGDISRRCIDNTLWSYLRCRLFTNIPEVDPNISPGQQKYVGDFVCGEKLGEGAFGSVFKVRDDLAQQVIKCVPKDGVNIGGIKALKAEIAALQLLSQERLVHENIVQIYEVYHSWTHVFIRMQYGGSQNLHSWLRSRDGSKTEMLPLCPEKVMSIISQCIAALRHMHVEAMIAHRDIKPANIVILESPDDIKVKLTDFGLAKVIAKSKCKSRESCGTLPFMAPEVVLAPFHDVFLADVWSLGVVYLELLCFTNFIERVFEPERSSCPKTQDKGERKRMGRRLMEGVCGYFERADSITTLLDAYIRLELQALSSVVAPTLKGMLCASPCERWTAAEAAEAWTESFCSRGAVGRVELQNNESKLSTCSDTSSMHLCESGYQQMCPV